MKLDPWITRLHHAAMLAELSGFAYLAWPKLSVK